MRKLLILMVGFVATLSLHGQSDVAAVEYYIDTDPGVGLATSVTISGGQEIDINFTVPVSGMGLNSGLHLIGIRTQNAAGEWSLYEKRVFYIQESAGSPPPVPMDVTALEYFTDEDPGVGLATSVAITPGQGFDINAIVASAALPDGFHLVGMRAMNADNRWGFTEFRIFYIQNTGGSNPAPSDVRFLEYFFDEDPGTGMANNISITAGQSIDINDLISTAALTDGFHTVSVRAQNDDGRWGMSETRILYIQNTNAGPPIVSPISALEYYIDDDPGIGQAIQVPITPSLQVVDIMNMALSTGGPLTIGTHTLTIRAQNEAGLWGHKESVDFQVDGNCPIAGFTVQNACVGEAIVLTDTSTDIIGTADYNWYADGILFSNVPGAVNHVFDSPGSHTLSLSIQNGAVCTDSTGVVIEVKAKPFVVFEADEVEAGTATTFQTEVFNLDPASTWEWDFDSDGTIDDTTPVSTSFTFPADGSYLTTLSITDGSGCGNSYSKSVTVKAPEVVIIVVEPPVPNFEVTDVCLGEPSSFINLSTEVPTDATWSWDFDGDGITDDNTAGSTFFTYTAAGIYSASLTIETATMESFSFTSNVVVSEVPVADFTITSACESDPVIFTDNSQNTTSATYAWDFDNDGVIDSQVAGDVSFTYPQPGSYSASLFIENPTGCFDFKVVSVVLMDEVTEADFDFTYNTSSSGASVVFENKSVNGVGYSWDFGDGNTSAESSPTHEFQNGAGQTFDICLTSTNACTTDVYCENVTFTVTGIQQLEDVGIRAYPNPGDGHVNLDFSNAGKDLYSITIYDLTGKLILEMEHDASRSSHFEKKRLGSGSYILRVTSDELSAQQKLIVR